MFLRISHSGCKALRTPERIVRRVDAEAVARVLAGVPVFSGLSDAERTELIAHLRARGILAVFHYLPLHLSPMGRRLGGREGDCPIAEHVAERLVRLPFFTGLTDDEQALVIQGVREFEFASV